MKQQALVIALSAILLSACGKKEEAPAAAAPAAAPVASAPAAPPPPPANTEEKVLNVYNWPDYIAADMVANFEKETGIKVNYQTFENNEGLQAKLVAGNSGFDIVVPGAVFAKSQIDGGLLMKLDKSKIPNLANLDPTIMAKSGQRRCRQRLPRALGLELHHGGHQQGQGCQGTGLHPAA